MARHVSVRVSGRGVAEPQVALVLRYRVLVRRDVLSGEIDERRGYDLEEVYCGSAKLLGRTASTARWKPGKRGHTLEHVVGYDIVSKRQTNLDGKVSHRLHSHSSVCALTPCSGSLMPNFVRDAVSLRSDAASCAGVRSAPKLNLLMTWPKSWWFASLR